MAAGTDPRGLDLTLRMSKVVGMGTYETGLARRQAHTHIKRTCACGRVLEGNGAVRHLRTCPQQLAAHGWRLDKRMAEAIRDEYRIGSSHIIRAVERRLGDDYLARREAGDLSEMSWPEYRDRVWQYADQAASQTWP